MPQSLRERILSGAPLPFYFDWPLRAATVYTRAAMRARLARRPDKVDARVISVGNLTAGGTGKSPAVIERAEAELARGEKVAVLTRGYHAARGGEYISSALAREDWFAHLGDEPALMLRRLPEITVFKGKNRVRLAMIAVARGFTSLILDDGYQYTLLARDENILVIDATNPFGNGHLLPRGILREPPEAMGRATQIILTRCDQAGSLSEIEAAIARYAPGVPVRKTVHAAAALVRLIDNAERPLDGLKNVTVHAACAVGNPAAFFASLESLGAKLKRKDAYPDHAPFDPTPDRGCDVLVVTEKDAVRIAKPAPNAYALRVKLADWGGVGGSAV